MILKQCLDDWSDVIKTEHRQIIIDFARNKQKLRFRDIRDVPEDFMGREVIDEGPLSKFYVEFVLQDIY